jgi:hypothetical protein
MKIRRKLPKLARSGRPAYIVGYSSAPPRLSGLRDSFDLEYGGPLKLRQASRDGAPDDDLLALVVASHGPWSASIQLSLAPAESSAWKERLGWGHPVSGQVLPTSATPREASDQVLHVARLARSITLLTDGTAYDVITHTYLNPSDWKDRPLDQFRASDHVAVEQIAVPDSGQEWLSTRGLIKFGLDEIETFRPLGLSSRPVIETLAGVTDELVKLGQTPKVGTTIAIPALGLSVYVIRHRTALLDGGPVSFREVVWQAGLSSC